MIGAGVAGLAAARVLSRRYATVTVLDRDTLPYGPTPRRGVPQGEHPHILLVGGLRELGALFPGFAREHPKLLCNFGPRLLLLPYPRAAARPLDSRGLGRDFQIVGCCRAFGPGDHPC